MCTTSSPRSDLVAMVTSSGSLTKAAITAWSRVTPSIPSGAVDPH